MKHVQLNNSFVIIAILISLSFCGIAESQKDDAKGISKQFQDTVKEVKYRTLEFDSLNNPIIIYCYENVICQVFIKQDSIVYENNFSESNTLSSVRQYYLSENNEIIAHGCHFYYNISGKLSHIYTYQNGLLNGDFLVYDENGNVIERITYLNDKKMKEWRAK
jgi:antitoxin component YwqK of YwqJK toxin-antitoxin module